ncbi:MAG: hypothetical protein QNK40_15990, partial [Desulfobacterales bacterium]|nr:hypothetical protein [Desulfobacterales bacterium]MDX2510344.1 hypothetical protein [Desulfobacterales bacterium]
ARGKNDQYGFPWQPHKFYWRILTPFLSGIVALSTYLLIQADFFPLEVKNKESAKLAFSLCFILGYFSDLVLSRLAAWAESVIPNKLIRKIMVDREIGITIYAFNKIKEIKLGYENYTDKYDLLKKVLLYIKNLNNFQDPVSIDLNNFNRVVVNLAR